MVSIKVRYLWIGITPEFDSQIKWSLDNLVLLEMELIDQSVQRRLDIEMLMS